ncbi:MAG: hydrogenase expression/formation protein HypE [Bacillota bacterium]|nr:hydrogenase expression/formation protein HypE [Bacillota bacterium]
MKITTAHGGGGKLSAELIHDIFERYFSNSILNEMQDSAVLPIPSDKIAFTTDSFVVNPLFFSGGDIGRLAVCGTVNDLLMRGAIPKYLSAGFILEEGLDTDLLLKVVRSMQLTAKEAGVIVVAGDTKVIEGKGGLYINTSGIGLINDEVDVSAKNVVPNDTVIISGYLGNHHACIMSKRMGIENTIESDCAPLCDMVNGLIENKIHIHAMRDITRGGLATVLNEIALSSCVNIDLFPDLKIADEQVEGFCNILGLDPLYMGNEGKMVVFVPTYDADKALNIIKASKYGKNAKMIGTVKSAPPEVTIKTRSGGTRIIEPLMGEGLPRIC